MSAITLTVPDDLAERLRGQQERLPEIIELVLRQLDADPKAGYEGPAEVMEFLAGLPTPQEILLLRPSEAYQRRISELLEKNRNQGLNPEERASWERYEYLEHLVGLAKAKALQRLDQAPNAGG